MRRPLGDDERTRKPMRRFLRVLCGWNVLFTLQHLPTPNSSQNSQGTISQKNEANNLVWRRINYKAKNAENILRSFSKAVGEHVQTDK
jgi:hypothetical protein